MTHQSLSRSDLDRGFEAIQKLSNFRIDLAKHGRDGMIGVVAALIYTGERSEADICHAVAGIYGTAWDDTVQQILREVDSSDTLPQLWMQEGNGTYAPGAMWAAHQGGEKA